MPQTARRWTVEEVLALPYDGKRYELVGGELLVTPAPRFRHQDVMREVFRRLDAYLNPLGHGRRLLWSPADITWGEAPRVAEELVQPDLFVIHPDDRLGEWLYVTRLALAVEVLSPSTSRADRSIKRKSYQRHGVGTYWIVDADARLVEVWHPNDERPAIATEVLTWQLDDGAPELRIPLTELFAPPRA